MKIKTYTVNIGGYDAQREDIENINNYTLFRNNARNSRMIKILPHKFFDADFSIYCDSHIKIKDEFTHEWLITNVLKDADMCVAICRTKDCLYQEIEAAKTRLNDKEELELLVKQGEHYRAIGYPEHNGLYGYQPLIRKHSPIMIEFCESWWAELCRWSYRDQVSFPYVLSKFPELKLSYVDLSLYYNKLSSHGTKVFPKIIPH